MSVSIFFWLVLYGTSNLILAVSNRSNCTWALIYPLSPNNSTITIVHLHILQVMNVMYTCLGEIKGMDDST